MGNHQWRQLYAAPGRRRKFHVATVAYYISAKTLHVLWLEYEEAPEPGATPVKYTWAFHYYRGVQNTLVPYRTVLLADGKQVQETRILTVTYGLKLEDSIFRNPEAQTSANP